MRREFWIVTAKDREGSNWLGASDGLTTDEQDTACWDSEAEAQAAVAEFDKYLHQDGPKEFTFTVRRATMRAVVAPGHMRMVLEILT